MVAGLLCSCGGSIPPPEMPLSAPSPLLDRPLPDLGRPTMTGRRLDADALDGRVVVVKFFARYCRPCRRTLPEAQSLHASRDDVVVVGISLDEDAGAAMQQILRYRLTFPVIHDRGRLLGGRFRVTQLPMTFVTDREHRIVWVGGPETSNATLRQAVAAALRPVPN
jgi:peroxiredoxin